MTKMSDRLAFESAELRHSSSPPDVGAHHGRPDGAPGLDLFGRPILPQRGRGRPRHEVTLATQRTVAKLVADGRTQPEIAAALGVTIPTLSKYYRAELQKSDRLRHRAGASA